MCIDRLQRINAQGDDVTMFVLLDTQAYDLKASVEFAGDTRQGHHSR